MTRAAASALAALGLAAVPAPLPAQEAFPSAEQYHLRLEYRDWHPALASKFQKGFGDEPGTLLDAEKDLGLQDERTFQAQGTLQFSRGHKLRGGYTPLDYDGDVTARRTFQYGATTYDRFERVVTSVKGGYYSGEFEWDFVRGARGFLGGVVGARVFDVDTVLVAPEEGKRETDTLRVPIPVLGMAGRAYAGRLSLEGEFVGLPAGNRGHIYELDITAQAHLGDRLAVKGGYRRLSLHGTDEPDEIDFELGGWHFGVELSL